MLLLQVEEGMNIINVSRDLMGTLVQWNDDDETIMTVPNALASSTSYIFHEIAFGHYYLSDPLYPFYKLHPITLHQQGNASLLSVPDFVIANFKEQVASFFCTLNQIPNPMLEPDGPDTESEVEVEVDADDIIPVVSSTATAPEEDFFVDHIVVMRIEKTPTGGYRSMYKVRWLGYTKKHDTWEPLHGVNHTDAYKRFARRQRAKQIRKRNERKAALRR